MTEDRYRQVSAVHLILVRNNKVLLLRRFNTGYEDGNYSLIAGHIDEGETASTAMVREAFEEAGIRIDLKDLKFASVMHRKSGDTRIDFFFTTKTWKGIPANKEPQKCDDLSWFKLDNLPDNVVPYVAYAIECYKNDTHYSEFGW
jgi:8-oxo-dGTP diphosphatase